MVDEGSFVENIDWHSFTVFIHVINVINMYVIVKEGSRLGMRRHREVQWWLNDRFLSKRYSCIYTA
jgi:hypothetical protein